MKKLDAWGRKAYNVGAAIGRPGSCLSQIAFARPQMQSTSNSYRMANGSPYKGFLFHTNSCEMIKWHTSPARKER